VSYIDLLNAFDSWLEVNYLSATAQLLWYRLMAIFNRCGWSEWVTVDNQRIMMLIQCSSEHTVIDTRNRLIQAGLIEYVKGKKGCPGKYRVGNFTAKNAVHTAVHTAVYSAVNTAVHSAAL